MSGKYFDYGTGSKPKFAKKKRVKRVRDRKAAAAKSVTTKLRKKFNKTFDYGLSAVAAPKAPAFPKLLTVSDYKPHPKHKKKVGFLRALFSQ